MSTSTSHPDTAHPLALQLSSLRSSLGRFQHVAHKTSMQLQGKTMELTLARENEKRLEDENRVLLEELEILRRPLEGFETSSSAAGITSSSSGSISAIASSSSTTSAITALSELTLAHRRLSNKLTLTEEHQISLAKKLAISEAEVEHLKRDNDRKVELVDWWKERMEGWEKEKREERIKRRKVEEELKVCELALKQLKAGSVSTTKESPSPGPLTPSPSDIVSPSASGSTTSATPSETAAFGKSLDSAPSSLCPACHTPSLISSDGSTSTSTILTLARQSVRDLFTSLSDEMAASSSIATKQTIRIEELEKTIDVIQEVATLERDQRVLCSTQMERMKADDSSAGAVVERYMAFTQKTSQQLHSHLQSQTKRLNQTIATLRFQAMTNQRLLKNEMGKVNQLREAIDELAEGFERETFGRRREIGLRMKALEREERRWEEGRRWSEKVRRERGKLNVGNGSGNRRHPSMSGGTGSRPGTPSHPGFYLKSNGNASSISLSSNGTNDPVNNDHLTFLWDLLESGLLLFTTQDTAYELKEELRKISKSDHQHGDAPDDEGIEAGSSLGRVLLAEGMVEELMEELEAEMKRRIALEKKVGEVLILSSEAEMAESTEKEVLSPSEAVGTMDAVEPPIEEPATPRQKDLFPEANLPPQTSYPGGSIEPESNPEMQALLRQLSTVSSTRYAALQKALYDCAASVTRLRQSSSDRQLDSDQEASLEMLLDGIHDVIEDVRVEVEIAITDDERLAKGFETLLSVTPSEASIGKATAFLDGEGSGSKKLQNLERRLGDVEFDLVELKVAAMTLQPGPVQPEEAAESSSPDQDAFGHLQLRTVKAPTRRASQGRGGYPGLGTGGAGMQRGFFGSLGRTFSGTTPTQPLSRTGSIVPILPRTPPVAGSPGLQESPLQVQEEPMSVTPEENVSAVEEDDVE